MTRTALLALALMGGTLATASAADPNAPHPHQGVLTPYPTPPTAPTLTTDELAKLLEGEVVRKQTQGDSGGRGIAVQDIHATPEVIWSKILDYPNYPTMVDGVLECEQYAQSGSELKARFKIGAMGTRVEYYIDHEIHTDANWMTWTLDYTRESDLDDSVGYWLIEPLTDRPGYSRVYYSVAVQMRGWVPGFIESMIARKGLTQATEWVKAESESAAGH
jgi:hypothetical protein